MLEAEEIQLYDRQIRLWGLESQKSLTKSTIGITGVLNGTMQEVVKNISLAGVGCLRFIGIDNTLEGTTLMGKSVEEMVERVRVLNGRVKVEFGDIDDGVSLLLCFGLDYGRWKELNARTRQCGCSFVLVDVHGMLGGVFVDGLEHSYIREKPKNDRENETSHHVIQYDSIDRLESIDWSKKAKYKDLYELWQYWMNGLNEGNKFQHQDICPASAIIGGLVSQEVIKLLCHKDEPINYCMSINAMSGEAKIL